MNDIELLEQINILKTQISQLEKKVDKTFDLMTNGYRTFAFFLIFTIVFYSPFEGIPKYIGLISSFLGMLISGISYSRIRK